MAITISLSGLNGDWQVNNQSGINRIWTRGIYSIVYSENMFGTSNAGWIVKITDGVEIFGIKTISGEVWDDDAEIIWNPNATGYDDDTTANLVISVIEEANPIDVNPAYYKCDSVTETTWTGYKMKWDKDNGWINQESLTNNLTISGFTPEKDKVYNVNTTSLIYLYPDSGNTESPDLTNLKAENIKYGETINGIDGTYTSVSVDDPNTPVTSGDMLYGTIAFVNGKEVIGEVERTIGIFTVKPDGTIRDDADNIISEVNEDGTIYYSRNDYPWYESIDITVDVSEINPSIIKAGSSLFDVKGTFTADATATEADILDGKTAYVNGILVIGKHVCDGGSTEVVDDNIIIVSNAYIYTYDDEYLCLNGVYTLVNPSATGGQRYWMCPETESGTYEFPEGNTQSYESVQRMAIVPVFEEVWDDATNGYIYPWHWGFYQLDESEVGAQECPRVDISSMVAYCYQTEINHESPINDSAWSSDILNNRSDIKLTAGSLSTDTPTVGGVEFYECTSYTPESSGGTIVSFTLSGADDEKANGEYIRTQYTESPDSGVGQYTTVGIWINSNGYVLQEMCAFAEFFYAINDGIKETFGSDYIYMLSGYMPERLTGNYNHEGWMDNGNNEVSLVFSDWVTGEAPPKDASWSGYKMTWSEGGSSNDVICTAGYEANGGEPITDDGETMYTFSYQGTYKKQDGDLWLCTEFTTIPGTTPPDGVYMEPFNGGLAITHSYYEADEEFLDSSGEYWVLYQYGYGIPSHPVTEAYGYAPYAGETTPAGIIFDMEMHMGGVAYMESPVFESASRSAGWVKAETPTEGLTAKGYTPELGKVYSQDTTVYGVLHPEEIPSGGSQESTTPTPGAANVVLYIKYTMEGYIYTEAYTPKDPTLTGQSRMWFASNRDKACLTLQYTNNMWNVYSDIVGGYQYAWEGSSNITDPWDLDWESAIHAAFDPVSDIEFKVFVV